MERGRSKVNADGSFVIWDSSPFAQGVERYAYQGNLYKIGKQPTKCVIKTFKYNLGSSIDVNIKSKKVYQCSMKYTE